MCRKERSAQPKFLPAGWRPTATLGPRRLTGVLVPCGQAKGAASPSLPTRLEVFATQDVWDRSAHRQPRSRNALERSSKPGLQLNALLPGTFVAEPEGLPLAHSLTLGASANLLTVPGPSNESLSVHEARNDRRQQGWSVPNHFRNRFLYFLYAKSLQDTVAALTRALNHRDLRISQKNHCVAC
jgi:hypothetical protein